MKPKSTRQKGQDFQNWIEKYFKKNYPEVAVHNQKSVASLIKIRDKKTGQLKDVWVSKRNDLLGCVDLLIIIPNQKPLFIQATLHTGVTKRVKELEKVLWDFRYCDIQLWQKKRPGEVHIKQFDGKELIDYAKILRGKYYTLEHQCEPI